MLEISFLDISSDLSSFYIISAGTIVFLFLAAKRNRKQGWRRQRICFHEAALQAFTRPHASPSADATADHLGGLVRLCASLLSHGEPIRPEPGEATLSPTKRVC